MLTALVLQLIQCVVVLPRKMALGEDDKLKIASTKSQQSGMGPDVIDLEAKAAADPDGSDNPDDFIMLKYRDAMGTAHKFLTVFLEKCRSPH